jgi:hypothetical protein
LEGQYNDRSGNMPSQGYLPYGELRKYIDKVISLYLKDIESHQRIVTEKNSARLLPFNILAFDLELPSDIISG